MSGHENSFNEENQEILDLAQKHTGRFVAGLEIGLEVVDEQRESGELKTHEDHEQAVVKSMKRIDAKYLAGVELAEDEERALVTGSQEAIDQAFSQEARAAELAS